MDWVVDYECVGRCGWEWFCCRQGVRAVHMMILSVLVDRPRSIKEAPYTAVTLAIWLKWFDSFINKFC